MGADFILHRECEPKMELGEGDAHRGTMRILGMLKAKSREAAVYSMLEREGESPATATITVMVLTADGPQEREVSVAEMMQEAAPLESRKGHCLSCDACAVSSE